jgi:hypothetical protein
MNTYLLITTQNRALPCFGYAQLKRTIKKFGGVCYWKIKDPIKTNGVYVSVSKTTIV